jgi:hypothetical protein
MKRFEKAYEEAKRNAGNMEKPLIHGFLGKHIQVKISESLTVEGTLIYYQFGCKSKPHRPHVLILKNDDGFHVLRGNWLSISGGGENSK